MPCTTSSLIEEASKSTPRVHVWQRKALQSKDWQRTDSQRKVWQSQQGKEIPKGEIQILTSAYLADQDYDADDYDAYMSEEEPYNDPCGYCEDYDSYYQCEDEDAAYLAGEEEQEVEEER